MTASSGTRRTAARTGSTSRKTSRTCRSGARSTQIWPSTFDPGTAYVAVSFHLMDDRKPYIYKTTDFGATGRRSPATFRPAIRSITCCRSPAIPNRKGDALCRHGTRLLLLARRRRDVDAVQGRTAAGAGELDHRRAALPRRRRLDVRPRAFHPAQHHAAGADRANGRRTIDHGRALRRPRRSSARRAACSSRPGGPHFTLALPSAPSGPIQMEILDADGKTLRTQTVAAHEGLNGLDWDLRLRRRRRSWR